MSVAEASRPVLDVKGLVVGIDVPAGTLHAVDGIDFSVAHGETFCLVGESGCGKTMAALAVMQLLPRRARFRAERIAFEGRDLVAATAVDMARLRGERMAMIFQDPMTSLNPVYTVGNQLEEVYIRHGKGGRREARERARYLLDRVGIMAPDLRLAQYPHQLSGGLRQRMMIVMALMCDPALIIADEPTTALDVTVQAQILHLLDDLQREFQMALVLITHDLGVVARMADRVAVMYAGQIVETGTAAEVFARPLHPYTQRLLKCLPAPGRTERGSRLGSIPGIVPPLIGEFSGCLFRNRCPHAELACGENGVPFIVRGPGRASRCLFDTAALAAKAAPGVPAAVP
jgi:peptide/nickel transport system ATP-binding protein